MSSTHGQKLAALLLAGWSKRDRDWALRQLPAHQRASLIPLLRELAGKSLPPMSMEMIGALTGHLHSACPRTGELAPLRPLLRTLPSRWASRLLQAWDVPAAEARSLIDDEAKADAIVRALDKPARPIPPRLAASLRELSTRQAHLLSTDIRTRDARHG